MLLLPCLNVDETVLDDIAVIDKLCATLEDELAFSVL